jgi:hypothetical protein
LSIVTEFAPHASGGSVFTLDMELVSGVQRVVYRPSFAEIMKYAWVQYIAVWWLIWAVFYLIRRAIFSSHVFSSTWDSSATKSKLS